MTELCAACGRPIDGAPDAAAHWDFATGVSVHAWSCSDACAAVVEARRMNDGYLPWQPGCKEE